MRHSSKRPFLQFIVGLSVAGFILFVIFAVRTYFRSPAKTDVTRIVGDVGALMVLPSEEPTIAAIADVTKLRDQQFFSQAENGDYVLIYNLAKKAILYRPKMKKIIDVISITVTPITPTPENK